MSTKYDWRVSLESATGFVLDTDQLDVDQLGFLTTPLDDPRVKIRSVSMSGGRNRELDAIPPSTLTIVFDNRDGLFNPNDTSSPYFGLIFPGKAISLDYVNKVAGVAFDYVNNIFSGVVTDWSFDFDINGDATATVSAKDMLGLLAGIDIPATAVPQESTDARFKRICLLAGLNDSQVATGGSYSVMASGTIQGDALQLVQEVLFHEQGYTLVYGGIIFFQARNTIVNGYNAFFTNTGTGEGGIYNYPFSDLQVAYSTDTVATSVTTTSTLGTAVFTDSAKVAQFGLFSNSYDVSYSTFAQQNDLAGYLVNAYGAPEFRPNSLTVSIDGLMSLPNPFNNDIDGYGAVQFVGLASSYGLPVRVLFNPPGDSVDWIDETLVVSSWSHSSTPSGYNVTIGLEPNPFQNVFVLDNLFFGVLDEDKLGF
jgi:hypothetical protein